MRRSACTRAIAIAYGSGNASFTRSFDPCTSLLTCLRWRKPWGPRRSERHRGWESSRQREEPAPVSPSVTQRGSPRAPASRKEAGRHVRNGRRSWPPSLRGSTAPVWLPVRRSSLQKSIGDVWFQIRPANALQKERQGRVNGDLARGSHRGIFLGVGLGRKDARGPASPHYGGGGPAPGPGWREIVIQRSPHRQRR